MHGMIWVRAGAILGALAVAAGAFGAHSLEGRIEARMVDIFKTGATYQMFHALALVGVGLLIGSGRGGASASVAGWSFLLGTLIFSGTLYALALSGIRWLGAITPIGGVLMIVGWIALALAAGPSRGTNPNL
ncbi:DUF423 domain-containing protein [Tundrisphaera sp. TA3]|uniref:DUF423 domain-containing protein n=1 Tax=Tundrisphaera sp. TA3 TaxID=3435775 RepID=UPI003EB70E4E